ncbi:MAG: chemotaxis protein CheW [Gammaproteobacteria bacterium]|nr:chemotaxis protein CheW [Gammaproteobacteria bacterium]
MSLGNAPNLDLIDNVEDADAELVQYLTFMMAEEEYGIEILSVQEIRGWEPMTQIPNTPEYVKGVINLRGTVVPVIDLRLRFQLPKIDYSDITVVVIVKVRIAGSEKIMGIVVDAVSDVYSLEQQAVSGAPHIGDVENKEFIEGLINVNDKMVVLLDLKKVLDI